MRIQISRNQAVHIGFDKFEPYGFDQRSWGWKGNRKVEIDLRDLDDTKRDKLIAMLQEMKHVYGLGTINRDIARWLSAMDTAKSGLPIKKMREFEVAAIAFMRDVEGHRVYRKERNDLWFCYFVDHIMYKPTVHHRTTKWSEAWIDWEHVNISMEYELGPEGGTSSIKVRIDLDELGKTVLRQAVQTNMKPQHDDQDPGDEQPDEECVCVKELHTVCPCAKCHGFGWFATGVVETYCDCYIGKNLRTIDAAAWITPPGRK